MSYFLIYIISFISFEIIFSQDSWNTNIFDYSWNKISKRTMFREPIVFTPFEIRTGYFHYGGADYLKGFPIMGGNISQHPVLLDSTHLSNDFLDNIKDRNGLFIELDIAKTNLSLFLFRQNIVDIQFGLGYRMSHMLSRPIIPDYIYYSNPSETSSYNYKFFPQIYDFNINSTINWQINKSLIPYFYHSIGFSKISLYKTEGQKKYLYGDAISETFALGLKKIIKNNYQNKRYNLYYGSEIKSTQTTTLSLDDTYQFSPITGFNMRSINFNIIFGVIFGGNSTKGDEAFSMMLENDFESAIPLFEEYIEKYPKHGRIKKAKKMVSFCKEQLPHQNYKKAINKLKDNNISEAVALLNEAYFVADSDLKLNIDYKKEEIAKDIIEEIENNIDKYAIKECENLLNIALRISPLVKDDVNSLKGELFLKKATLLHESNLLNDALEYYQRALSYDETLEKIIKNRLEVLVNGILNNAQKYQANNELLLAIKSLKKAIELQPDLSFRLSSTIAEFENIILESNNLKTQQTMKQIIDDSKSKGREKKLNLIIGMTKDKIIEILDMPDNIEFINSSLSSYEIWLYIKLNKKLYIKDERLNQIQRIEEE